MARTNQSVTITIDGQMDVSKILVAANQVKGAFNNIDPNSTLGRKIGTLTKRIETEMDKITESMNKGFKSGSEVTSFQNHLRTVASLFETLNQQSSKVKFGDLIGKEATQAAQELVNLNKQIDENSKKLKNYNKTQIKDLFADTQTGPLLKEADVKESVRSLTSMQNQVKSYTDTLRQQGEVAKINIAEQEQAYQRLADAIKLIGENTTDKGAFKQGTKTSVVEQLKAMGFDEIEMTQSARAIREAIEQEMANMKLDTAPWEQYKAQLEATNVKIVAFVDVLAKIAETSGAGEAEIAAITTEIERLKNATEQVKADALANANAPLKELSQNSQDAGQYLDSLGGKAQGAGQQLLMVADSAQRLGNIESTLKRWTGMGMAFMQVSKAVKVATNQIKELDAAMNSIAVVTDMTTADLWGQIDSYMATAKAYGVATKGVYEVAQIYYQTGMATNQVMNATTETLKLARISGLAYADASDSMIVAMRAFNIEVADASRIVDVYSKIAAISAADSEELSIAMSKVGASAALAGTSFESTTAILATIQEAKMSGLLICEGKKKILNIREVHIEPYLLNFNSDIKAA